MNTPGTAEQALNRLEWTVLRRLDGLLQGDYRTVMRGAGLDLADLREYQSGDEVRHIDWNVTARLQTPHVRVYNEDRELSAWLLIDLSASLDFGSGARTKRQQLTDFVGVLARLLTRHGNRIGAVLYGPSIQRKQEDAPMGVRAILPPGASRRHVLQLLHLLTASEGQGAERESQTSQTAQTTRLHELLAAASGLLKRRSAVFLLSDFISEPGWERPLAHLARRHELTAVRFYDPLERQLPDLGLLPLQDAESGEVLLVDTQDPVFRARFARLAEQQEDALREKLARAGAETLELATDEDLLPALLRFARLRQQRGRAQASKPAVHLRLIDKEAA